MMAKNPLRKNLILWANIVCLASCTAKSFPTPHKSLEPVPQNPTTTQSLPPDPQPQAEVPSACGYWNSLGALSASDPAGYQIVSDLQLKGQTLLARHNLQTLPEVLYALSGEANGGKKPIDPPSIPEFMKLAEQRHSSGQLSDLDFSMLNVLKGLGATGKILELRNQAIQAQVEAELPGVFSGQSGPVGEDQLFKELARAAGISRPLSAEHFHGLQPLLKKVSLFGSPDWSVRSQELAMEFSVLNAETSWSLPFDDLVCRFAITHRIEAQLLSLKGMHQAPVLKKNGLLQDIPKQELARFPEQEIKGVYQTVVDASWIHSQLSHPSARALGMESSAGFVDGLSYLVSWTKQRDPDLWSLSKESPSFGDLKIPDDLLKLGFGLLGVELKVFATEELVQPVSGPAAGRILLRQDSPDAFAKLGLLTLSVQDAYAGLNHPNSVESEILSPEDINQFTAPYPLGLVAQFQMLMNGVVLDGIFRIQHSQGSESLRAALHEIGRRLGNTLLTEI